MAIVLAIITALAILLALRGLFVMLLWNYVAVGLLNLPEMSFFQAVAAVLLMSFLVGSVVDKNALPASKKAEKK